jgi:predicted RNA-binding protein with TRAM domain
MYPNRPYPSDYRILNPRYSPFILGRKLRLVQMSYGRYSGGGRDFNRGFAPKPVEKGKEYEVDVTEVSRQGDGIARVQGYVIFVKNGKPGQKLKVQVNQVGARFATATIVVSPSQ